MFFTSWIEMGGFELNHHWHGINVLSMLECCLLAAVLLSVMALFARFIRKSKRLTALSLAGALSFATAAYAANTQLSLLSASGALAGANLIYVVQTAGSGGVKATMTQVATFINSLFSGDATVASGGAVTLATVNANVGSFGSATNCTSVTVNAKGLITAASQTTCTPGVASITGMGTGIPAWLATPSSANLFSALTTKTGSGGSAVFATGPTISSVILSTAAQLSYITGSIQCLHVDASGNITGTGSDCGSGSGGVTSIAGNTGAFTLNSTSGLTNATNDIKCQASSASQFGCAKPDGSTITASAGVLTAVPGVTSRTVTGATDTILAADRGNVVYYNSASSIAVSQPAPSGSFAAGFFTTLCNINAGVATVTPVSGTVGGGSTYAIPAGTAASPSCISYQSDSTNFNTVDLLPTYGSGVQTALGKATNTAGALGTVGTSGATLPLLNGTNTFSGTQTFGSLFGTVTTQSGTTYTLAASDCGTEVVFTNAAATTVTIPAALTTGCNIALLQTTSAGQITVTGTAVSAATLHSAHSYTKTFGPWATIGISIYTTGVAILTGDGA